MMRYYTYDKNYVYSGSDESKAEGIRPRNSVLISPPLQGNDGKFFRWEQNGWVVYESYPEPAAVVPQSVSKRQGRQQMIIMGVYDQVQPIIDAIIDPLERALVQSFWDDSSMYERNHPQMIQLAEALGLTMEELDQAFISAQSL